MYRSTNMTEIIFSHFKTDSAHFGDLAILRSVSDIKEEFLLVFVLRNNSARPIYLH